MSGFTMERLHRVAVPLAVGGLAFQVFHFVEHIAQAGYWMLHPTEKPWLTPWAEGGRDLLPGDAGVGTELLHLVGNTLFFAGLLAMCVVLAARSRRLADHRALRWAVGIQGFHLVEHVLLTTTFIAGGEALGFSTLFGGVSGAFGSSLRVWFHFMINLAATWTAVVAFREMYRDQLFFSRPIPAPIPAT